MDLKILLNTLLSSSKTICKRAPNFSSKLPANLLMALTLLELDCSAQGKPRGCGQSGPRRIAGDQRHQQQVRLITSKPWPITAVLAASLQVTWSVWSVKLSWSTFYSHGAWIPQDTTEEGAPFSNILLQALCQLSVQLRWPQGWRNLVAFDCSRNCCFSTV